MQSIMKRIEALETAIKNRNIGLFSVYYKDGTIKKIHAGDVIRLSLEEADKIERFEEDEGGNNDGILEGLANALIIPNDMTEETEA